MSMIKRMAGAAALATDRALCPSNPRICSDGRGGRTRRSPYQHRWIPRGPSFCAPTKCQLLVARLDARESQSLSAPHPTASRLLHQWKRTSLFGHTGHRCGLL